MPTATTDRDAMKEELVKALYDLEDVDREVIIRFAHALAHGGTTIDEVAAPWVDLMTPQRADVLESMRVYLAQTEAKRAQGVRS